MSGLRVPQSATAQTAPYSTHSHAKTPLPTLTVEEIALPDRASYLPSCRLRLKHVPVCIANAIPRTLVRWVQTVSLNPHQSDHLVVRSGPVIPTTEVIRNSLEQLSWRIPAELVHEMNEMGEMSGAPHESQSSIDQDDSSSMTDDLSYKSVNAKRANISNLTHHTDEVGQGGKHQLSEYNSLRFVLRKQHLDVGQNNMNVTACGNGSCYSSSSRPRFQGINPPGQILVTSADIEWQPWSERQRQLVEQWYKLRTPTFVSRRENLLVIVDPLEQAMIEIAKGVRRELGRAMEIHSDLVQPAKSRMGLARVQLCRPNYEDVILATLRPGESIDMTFYLTKSNTIHADHYGGSPCTARTVIHRIPRVTLRRPITDLEDISQVLSLCPRRVFGVRQDSADVDPDRFKRSLLSSLASNLSGVGLGGQPSSATPDQPSSAAPSQEELLAKDKQQQEELSSTTSLQLYVKNARDCIHCLQCQQIENDPQRIQIEDEEDEFEIVVETRNGIPLYDMIQRGLQHLIRTCDAYLACLHNTTQSL